MTHKTYLYIDSTADSETKQGAYAYALVHGERHANGKFEAQASLKAADSASDTTMARMLLTAAIEGLSALTRPNQTVTIVSRFPNFQKLVEANDPTQFQNPDLVTRLLELVGQHQVNVHTQEHLYEHTTQLRANLRVVRETGHHVREKKLYGRTTTHGKGPARRTVTTGPTNRASQTGPAKPRTARASTVRTLTAKSR